jgi:hypothetical protein
MVNHEGGGQFCLAPLGIKAKTFEGMGTRRRIPKNCHHEEGFSPTRDLLCFAEAMPLPAESRSLALLVMTIPSASS